MLIGSPKIGSLIELISRKRFNEFLRVSSAFLAGKDTRGIWDMNVNNCSYMFYIYQKGHYKACFYLDRYDTFLFIPSTSENIFPNEVIDKILVHFDTNRQAYLRFVHQKWQLVNINEVSFVKS